MAVGFGVRDAASAVAVAERADAVVIGSALVARLATTADREAALVAVGGFLAPIRKALDSTSGPQRRAAL